MDNNTTRRLFFHRFFKSSKATTASFPHNQDASTVSRVSFRPLSSQPYIGEVILVGFSFAPPSFLSCDGRLLAIAEYGSLFDIIGTTYGGDGQTTFGLPNLDGRAALGVGQGPGLTARILGESAGSNAITLTSAQLPTHTVTINQVTVRGVGGTEGTGLAKGAVAGTGSERVGGTAAAVDHTPPYLALNYIIAVEGILPPRN
jgi:microcystin-dependent protein